MTTVHLGAGTAELQDDLPDLLLRDLFTPYGKRGFIIHRREPRFGQVEATEATSPELPIVLLPAEERAQRAAVGAGLPVPAFTAYVLMRDAPDLGTPGWLLLVDGVRYHPTGDARDEGMQGVLWSVSLRSPQETTGAV